MDFMLSRAAYSLQEGSRGAAAQPAMGSGLQSQEYPPTVGLAASSIACLIPASSTALCLSAAKPLTAEVLLQSAVY